MKCNNLYFDTLLFQSQGEFYLKTKMYSLKLKNFKHSLQQYILTSEFIKSSYISQKRYNHVFACNKHLLTKYKYMVLINIEVINCRLRRYRYMKEYVRYLLTYISKVTKRP